MLSTQLSNKMSKSIDIISVIPNINKFNIRVKNIFTKLYNYGINNSFNDPAAANWTSCNGQEPILCQPKFLHSEELAIIRYFALFNCYNIQSVFSNDIKSCFKLQLFSRLYTK